MIHSSLDLLGVSNRDVVKHQGNAIDPALNRQCFQRLYLTQETLGQWLIWLGMLVCIWLFLIKLFLIQHKPLSSFLLHLYEVSAGLSDLVTRCSRPLAIRQQVVHQSIQFEAERQILLGDSLGEETNAQRPGRRLGNFP